MQSRFVSSYSFLSSQFLLSIGSIQSSDLFHFHASTRSITERERRSCSRIIADRCLRQSAMCSSSGCLHYNLRIICYISLYRVQIMEIAALKFSTSIDQVLICEVCSLLPFSFVRVHDNLSHSQPVRSLPFSRLLEEWDITRTPKPIARLLRKLSCVSDSAP